jgi:PEP-CTERM motif
MQMKMILSVACSACFATSMIWGATIVNTFGVGNSFVSPGFTVGGGIFPRHDPPPNQGVSAAWEFQATFSAILDEIDLAVQYTSPLVGGSGAPNLDVSLFSNLANQPGLSIETIHLTNVNGGSTTTGIASALSVSHPLLTAGTDYWLVVAPPDLLNTAFDWKLSPISNTGVIGEASSLGNAPWQSFATNGGGNAFIVTGTQVPEPTTFALGLLGILALHLLARRQRDSV